MAEVAVHKFYFVSRTQSQHPVTAASLSDDANVIKRVIYSWWDVGVLWTVLVSTATLGGDCPPDSHSVQGLGSRQLPKAQEFHKHTYY